MADNKQVLLSVEHLEQYFKMGHGSLKAVDDVNFEIFKGEVFGLVGESGCGKTTTGRSIIRLYDITGGCVKFNGQIISVGTRRYKEAISKSKKECKEEISSLGDNPPKEKITAVKEKYKKEIAELEEQMKNALYESKNCDKLYSKKETERIRTEYEEKISSASAEEKAALEEEYREKLRVAKNDRITNKIQMIFQDPIASLDPRMTVREIVAEGLIIRGVKDKKYIDEQVYKVLDLVGLVPEHAGRYPHEFSGGQRQRIGIARAIILNPELIIADEPISALDVSIQAQVINLLNELRSRLGLTIMFIAHDLSVVKYFSDRIAVMYFGKIVELATSDELFAHPLHPYTRSLLSAIPLPDPHSEKKRQRIVYNPIAEHDYSVDKPVMREVCAGHFVSANEAEFEKYQEILMNGKKAD